MYCLRIAAFMGSCLLLVVPCLGQPPCAVRIQPDVFVSGSAVTLADLLSQDSCAGALQAAAAIRVGAAPRTGSVRVLGEEELRRLAAKLSEGSAAVMVPERVTIRRAGTRLSCAAAEARLRVSGEAKSGVHDSDCGAAGRVASDAELQVVRKVWDPGLRRWQVIATCAHPEECVPFLVRVPQEWNATTLIEGRRNPAASTQVADAASAQTAETEKFVVRRGERTTLQWDQNGIRVTVPAVCLDDGHAGQAVRARISASGRVLAATVVRRGLVRAGS